MSRKKNRAQLQHTSAYFVKVIKDDQSQSGQGILIDISETGSQLSSSVPFRKDETAKLFWTPLLGVPALELEGICMWSEGNKAGFRFQNLSKKVTCVLKSVVAFQLGQEKQGPLSSK
jgi:hypothetical protein